MQELRQFLPVVAIVPHQRIVAHQPWDYEFGQISDTEIYYLTADGRCLATDKRSKYPPVQLLRRVPNLVSLATSQSGPLFLDQAGQVYRGWTETMVATEVQALQSDDIRTFLLQSQGGNFSISSGIGGYRSVNDTTPNFPIPPGVSSICLGYQQVAYVLNGEAFLHRLKPEHAWQSNGALPIEPPYTRLVKLPGADYVRCQAGDLYQVFFYRRNGVVTIVPDDWIRGVDKIETTDWIPPAPVLAMYGTRTEAKDLEDVGIPDVVGFLALLITGQVYNSNTGQILELPETVVALTTYTTSREGEPKEFTETWEETHTDSRPSYAVLFSNGTVHQAHL